MPRVTKKIYSFNKGWKMSNGWLMARPLSGNCSQIATLFSPIWIAATLTAIFLALAFVLDFFSSFWPFSGRIDRTLPKAQQTQESSACARVIAQTSQELVKVLHTMAKLWKAVSCHCPVVSTPKSATATMSTNFVLASSTASVKSIKSQLKESVN